MAKPKLTSKQYAKDNGEHCPQCKSNAVEGDGVEITAGGASQECYCLDCDATWIGLYELNGYFELGEGS